jgi:hypothetical protein
MNILCHKYIVTYSFYSTNFCELILCVATLYNSRGHHSCCVLKKGSRSWDAKGQSLGDYKSQLRALQHPEEATSFLVGVGKDEVVAARMLMPQRTL